MFGFKKAQRSKQRPPGKLDWKDVHSRHNAALEAERVTQASQPQPASRKKAGFGKRGRESH